MNKKCLLIETKDKRKFFTEEKNLKQLTEFANTFDVQMSLVEAEDIKVLKLEELAVALCNSICENTSKYKIIKKINRKTTSDKICKYIQNKFEKGQVVILKEIKEKFKECNLSITTFSNYISKTINIMTRSGFKIIKIGAGQYRIEE